MDTVAYKSQDVWRYILIYTVVGRLLIHAASMGRPEPGGSNSRCGEIHARIPALPRDWLVQPGRDKPLPPCLGDQTRVSQPLCYAARRMQYLPKR